jgi:hypothetical protein
LDEGLVNNSSTLDDMVSIIDDGRAEAGRTLLYERRIR